MDFKKSQKLYQAVIAKRRKEIKKLHEQGKSPQEIADKMEISRPRVYQILQSLNLK